MLNSIKRNLSFILVILIGLGAIAGFSIFYTKQKNFLEAQKEFLLALDKLEIDAHELSFAVLQNYIYAYNNNDLISKKLLDIETDFKHLAQTNILKQPHYARLRRKIEKLKTDIDETFRNVQRYLMYNATIKNSLLFLSSLQQKLAKKVGPEALQQSTQILQSLFLAKRTSDISYLRNYKLKNDPSLPPELQRDIALFNTHVDYIMTNLPLLMHLTKEIESNGIINDTKSLKRTFSQLSLKDISILNQFTIILLLVFITVFIYLMVILFRYKKEHDTLIKTTKSLRYSLTHDILTGLKNRIAFEKEKQNVSHPLIILVNLDRFKDINDVFGTEVGDQLLTEIAKLIRKIVEKQKGFVDAYRIGGDEFCLLFQNIDTQNALTIAQQIENTIAHTTFNIKGNELHVSVTLAINCDSPLLENADLALKAIKRQRTQKVVVYDDSLGLHQQAKKNIETVQMVKQALAEDRVVPYFQPIVNLKTGKVEKFEALVRIIEGDKVISPYFFLDVTRRTHLYFDITRTMLEKTFDIVTQHPQYRFSINLSIADIDNEEFVESLFSLFQKHILFASHIDIELLETEELYNKEKVKHFIDRLHSFGSLVLIDDFGSGYSNFAYFADFEIDIIKIDGSIIQEITTNRRKRHMLESIVMFAKNMNLKIVAEFVDNEDVATLLKQLDIEYAQGYLFSPPQPKPVTNLENTEI